MTEPRFYVYESHGLRDAVVPFVLDRFYCHEVVRAFRPAGQGVVTLAGRLTLARELCARLNAAEEVAA